MSTPQTTIYVCSGVRLNSKYEHSAYFASRADQQAYFSGKAVKAFPAYSFVRRSWTLKLESEYTDAVKWNYLFFKYPNDSRYYYYFINKVEYVNDRTVELTLELDLLQTYLLDVSFGECLIEREHVKNDEVGEHTIDEGLSLGDYADSNLGRLCAWVDSVNNEYVYDFSVIILSTMNPISSLTENGVKGGIYGNVYSGLGMFAVRYDDIDYLSNAISENPALTEAIVAMWVYPTAMIEFEGEQEGSELWCKNIKGTKVEEVSVNKPTTLRGYTPKNNKLLTYPYNVLCLSNQNGDSSLLKFERFMYSNTADFKLIGGLSPESSVRAVPVNYNGAVANNEQLYGVTLPSFPTCSWNSDTYKIWLAKNGHTQQAAENSAAISTIGGIVGIVGGAITTIASVASANPMGAVAGVGTTIGSGLSLASGVNQAITAMGNEEVAKALPDQARGTYSANIAMGNLYQEFIAIQRCVTTERAKRIDGFFTHYGYKVNRMGTPSIHNRKNFTYVKTSGCHAFADITNEDIIKIESIFDRGVTFWVNPNKIGDYSLDNSTL